MNSMPSPSITLPGLTSLSTAVVILSVHWNRSDSEKCLNLDKIEGDFRKSAVAERAKGALSVSHWYEQANRAKRERDMLLSAMHSRAWAKLLGWLVNGDLVAIAWTQTRGLQPIPSRSWYPDLRLGVPIELPVIYGDMVQICLPYLKSDDIERLKEGSPSQVLGLENVQDALAADQSVSPSIVIEDQPCTDTKHPRKIRREHQSWAKEQLRSVKRA